MINILLIVDKGGGFKSVHINDESTKVWAVDTNNNVFVRKGITESMPIGTSWLHVIGKLRCHFVRFHIDHSG